ncbi:mitotic spindle assembly checkpoint protein MAD1 isoform X2 [Callorhinus ursinus]|uniref:mitotic spindle assembly checkpoint protein MAD1 isoform X2 n=1 Tax=Callorhinus ursinus TaxID=34884 RepID=UPI003CD02A46
MASPEQDIVAKFPIRGWRVWPRSDLGRRRALPSGAGLCRLLPLGPLSARLSALGAGPVPSCSPFSIDSVFERRSTVAMDDLGENTTVLSTLRSLNSFISQRVEAGSGLDASASAPSSLQMQYQQSMQLEERAERIRSKSQVVQVEREKMQMELSHKRARVELERAASTSARRYEREVDRNQELLTRIRQLQEREAEAEEKMKEQLERHRLCKQSLDAAGQKLREKEDGLAAAGETISALKAKVSELQWSMMNQEMQVKSLESEKQELKEQLALQHKKCEEANQKVQELQASQEARADQEQRIRDLEQKLSLQEQDAAVVKNMKSELVRLPKMERELKQLREESAYLREMRETNGLLREELEGLRRRLGRQEKTRESLVVLELEKERLLAKLQSWERLEQTTGLSISARGLEKARQQLQEEVRQASSQLLEERKKRETQEALARRLQKRVLLLTKERDGMRAILGSYDSELTAAEYSPQLTRRMREAEDMVQKVHAHSSEMEAQLSQALEELGGQKQRADMLEMEVKMLQSQSSAAEQSFPLSREEASSLRLKIEELEGERSRLEEDKKMLEMQLERFTLQGSYDQSRTKVLHMSMNPASAAKQRLRGDQARLQEECEQLRELVRALERGGPVPAGLEAAASLPSSTELTAPQIRVTAPEPAARPCRCGKMTLLFPRSPMLDLPCECRDQWPTSKELRKQVESAELKNQRLKEVFQTKIQEFRKVCYALTGYQIDITTENQYRLTSMYAEHKADCLIFKATGPSGAKMQLLETAFSHSVRELIELHLLRQDSIPAFLSALTLDLFSRQTVA